jgi:hypothetical protein
MRGREKEGGGHNTSDIRRIISGKKNRGTNIVVEILI